MKRTEFLSVGVVVNSRHLGGIPVFRAANPDGAMPGQGGGFMGGFPANQNFLSFGRVSSFPFEMPDPCEDPYLELLKRTLCGVIYEPAPVPVEVFWCQRGHLKRWLGPRISRFLNRWNAVLSFRAGHSEKEIQEGHIWPIHACTMIGLKRMDNLWACVRTVLDEGIPGDFIETGVWRGGACIFMKGILSTRGCTDRKIYVADSFRGLPPPNAERYPADKDDPHHTLSYLAVSRAQVEANFRRFGLLDDRVIFLEGWFKDTLPTLGTARFAVIRLDGDMYESTMDALSHLYPRLSPGGFCIIDDYRIPNCREAVHDYRKQHDISEPMERIDDWSVFWRKKS